MIIFSQQNYFAGLCKDMMVGVSGTSHTSKIYEYYSCNKSRKKLCTKQNVPKDFIENLVITEARNILTDKNIDTITKSVVELANKENDLSMIKQLNMLLKENEKQHLNLLDSLKVCEIDSVRKTIFGEIAKMETEHKNIENQIRIENSQKLNLDEMQVRYFLEMMRDGDINNINHRKMIVNVLINRIYLYDDNITIFFNTQDKEFKSKVPTIEDIEVRIKDRLDSHIRIRV